MKRALLLNLEEFFDYKARLEYLRKQCQDGAVPSAAEIDEILEWKIHWKKFPTYYRSIEEDLNFFGKMRPERVVQPSQTSSSLSVPREVPPHFSNDYSLHTQHPASAPISSRMSIGERTRKQAVIISKLSSRHAEAELQHIQLKEQQFDQALENLLEQRLEQTVEYATETSISSIAAYLQGLFGEELYHDSLLSIVQQYALADVPIVNHEGMTIGKTGFHLSFFGDPGTGKTFAIRDIILGNPDLGIKAHGLIGRNRYCGSLTPAKFVRMAEAYQDKKFNFIVPEFDDWFRYKGMVNTLKLAMEGGIVEYETNSETIGPYRFGSFLSVNYNTRISGAKYESVIGDPHFNAIEDRMLNNLHTMSSQRYQALSRAREKIERGEVKMAQAESIQHQLMLIYAIQTKHPLVPDVLNPRQLEVTPYFYEQLGVARNKIMRCLEEQHPTVQGRIQFSPRLEKKALQLAGAMTLPSYFAKNIDDINVLDVQEGKKQNDGSKNDRGKNVESQNNLPQTSRYQSSRQQLDRAAVDYAIEFFIREAVVRSNLLLTPDLQTSSYDTHRVDEV